MRLVFAGFLAALSLSLTTPARAQTQIDSREGIALQNQILELKQEVQALRDQIASGGAGSSSALGSAHSSAPPSQASADMTAALLERVSRLEDEVRNLRGHVDEVDNARQRMGDDLSKQIDDLNFKLDNATPATPAAARPTTPPVVSRRTPELALQQGDAALARRDYVTAEAAAREVLTGPKTPRAIDAQYLLAEALAGKRDFANAAVAFDDTYKHARTGPHAQDALLGMAQSLSALDEKLAACATLDKLKAEFPTPRQDLRPLIAATRQQAACR